MQREKIRIFFLLKNETFHFVLVVVTICFAENSIEVLKEAFITLKKKGALILGTIVKERHCGRLYEAKASRNKRNRRARKSYVQGGFVVFKSIKK